MHNWVWNSYTHLEHKHICLCISKYSMTVVWIIYQNESTASLLSIICILHNSLCVLSSHCSDNAFKVFHHVLNLGYPAKHSIFQLDASQTISLNFLNITAIWLLGFVYQNSSCAHISTAAVVKKIK